MAQLQVSMLSTLETLLAQKKFNTIKDILSTMNPSDIAAVMEEAEQQRVALLFRLLPKALAAEAFVEMDGQTQEFLVQAFTDRELKEIVDELYMDDAVDLVEEMPSNLVKRILRQTDPETRRLINEMLKYPEDSAGSIMTTEFVDLSPEMTAQAAIDHIRATGVDSETINICYVVNRSRLLLGAVSIRTIILAQSDTPVEQLMESHVISVSTLEDKESVAQMFGKYNFPALPVVDTEDRLVGIVTFDDAIDVIQEEASEDISKMAAVTPSDKPYLRRSVAELWKSRVPWLLLLMISATFTGMIITHFEDALSTCLVLTSSIPMLMDTGGNSGSQASVTVIRSLSLQEISPKNLLAIVWKEARVAIACGLTLSAVGFAKLMLFDRVGFSIALVISVTMLATVFVAKLVGCTLPILAKKIGFDPAVMASPFITTIVDALSLLIYFGMATAVLHL